jgi:hypothetical protein
MPAFTTSKSKTWETTVGRVESWPEEARHLKNRDWIHYLFTIGDIVLVSLPIYFIRMSTFEASLVPADYSSTWHSGSDT